MIYFHIPKHFDKLLFAIKQCLFQFLSTLAVSLYHATSLMSSLPGYLYFPSPLQAVAHSFAFGKRYPLASLLIFTFLTTEHLIFGSSVQVQFLGFVSPAYSFNRTVNHWIWPESESWVFTCNSYILFNCYFCNTHFNSCVRNCFFYILN